MLRLVFLWYGFLLWLGYVVLLPIAWTYDIRIKISFYVKPQQIFDISYRNSEYRIADPLLSTAIRLRCYQIIILLDTILPYTDAPQRFHTDNFAITSLIS